MKAREFDVTIGSDGIVEVHVKGYKGRGCLEAAKLFEQIVGQLQAQRLTAEYYDPEEQVQYRVDQRH
jgi:hypothetical protein